MLPLGKLLFFVLLLAAVQFIAALPWLVLVLRDVSADSDRSPAGVGERVFKWTKRLLPVLIAAIILALFVSLQLDQSNANVSGRVYAVVLHVQLVIGGLILFFAGLLRLWPKGGAVALAAFREGWRQPMFWLLVLVATFLLLLSPYIPYFTFGEDFKMLKQLGYELIMITVGIFAVFAAAISISEEIEGRTAVTLLSKPITRRQLLLGKFTGILMAGLLMTSILAFFYFGSLLNMIARAQMGDVVPQPPDLSAWKAYWSAWFDETAGEFMTGVGYWVCHVVDSLPGVIFGFCQVMLLLSIATALATRFTMIANVVTCLVIFFLGHLTPILQQISEGKYRLVRFMTELFYYVLPGLELFNLGPAISKEAPPKLFADGSLTAFSGYIGLVVLYSVIYTAAALFFGLILFEDRDLA
ncbi:MAG: hypothetical protein KatS3mg105_2759 [Gemmatales bacterium]|nr:MAG: hypothetical protein KatS3mg105_2759 [Gemmatales bacterium]